MQKRNANKIFNKIKNLKNITNNSKQVRKGDVFFAISGNNVDGNRFIDDAIKNGARAIVTDNKTIEKKYKKVVEIFLVDSCRDSYAHSCSEYFLKPSLKLEVCGITGTNGKTSVAHLLKKIWEKDAGLIGTIETSYSNLKIESSLTTPDSYDLNKVLKDMCSKKVKKIFMEVSSHALAMSRVNYTDFDSCIFTNLTRDHLDFHKNMTDYFKAKASLFTERLEQSSKKEKFAVINIDNKWGCQLVKAIEKKTRTITYSLKNKKADFYLESVYKNKNKNTLVVDNNNNKFIVETELFGKHNFENILACCSYSITKGLDPEDLKSGIKKFRGAPGRLQKVKNTDLEIFIDYAHTPDALKKSIVSLKDYFNGRKITVLFGCGGNRDVGKRKKMGLIAEKFADKIIITSDNPRFENPESIIKDILKGVNKSKKVIINRNDAISWSIKNIRKNEVLLIAGKGHEDYQEINGKRLKFSDYREVKKCLRKIDY